MYLWLKNQQSNLSKLNLKKPIRNGRFFYLRNSFKISNFRFFILVADAGVKRKH